MKIKHGFSLIEVLLVLGIIAVVTAMGFSISKKGMENAYNLYWYTGYVTLYDSILDWNDKNNTDTLANSIPYAEHLHMLIRSDSPVPGENDRFTAPNGISYCMQWNNNNNNGNPFIRIDMEIPVHKLRTGAAPNRTIFIYFPNSRVSMVYPADTSSLTDADLVNLHDRADLLPFIRKAEDPSTALDRRTLYSFRSGYCNMMGATDGTLSGQSIPANINCSGFLSTGLGGNLIPINPRKVY